MILDFFCGPAMTLSIASSTSSIVISVLPLRTASSALSFSRFSKSAPVKPAVSLAIVANMTSAANGLSEACTLRISSRPLASGRSTTTRRSKRPGRSRAGSRTSGRFDRRVVVDLPDAKGREEILKVHASDKPFAADVMFATIAKETAGFTGADLENLLNESALLAVRRGKTDITMEEVEEAIDKVIAGPQKKSRVISADERRRIAYHEAGHAVVGKALAAREEVHRISIVSRGMALGFTLQLPTEDRYMRTSEELLREVAGLLGGSASEKLFLGSISTGPSNDLERATDVVHRMIRAYGMSEKLGPLTYGKTSDLVFLGKELSEERNYSEETAQTIDAEARRLVEEQYRRATEVLEMNRVVLDNLVTVLLDKETLQGPELEEALRGVIDLTASTVHIQAPASQSGSPVSTQPAS